MAFCQWCVDTGRAPSNPLVGPLVLNDELDPRRRARPLADAEIVALVNASDKRRDFYVVRAHTGRRIGTLKGLRIADVDLGRAVVRVRAGANKSRREKVKPLHEEAVEALRAGDPGRVQAHRPGVPGRARLKRDLARAGIAPVNDQGRQICRHCSRHTIGTRLA